MSSLSYSKHLNMKLISYGFILVFFLLLTSLSAQCLVPRFELESADTYSGVIEVDSLLTNGSIDSVVILLIRDAPAAGDESRRLDTVLTEVARKLELRGLEPDTRYSLTARSYCGTESSAESEAFLFFTLSLDPPANDLRGNAVKLAPGLELCTPVSGTTWKATGEEDFDDCLLADENDVWYAFKFAEPFNTIDIRQTGGTSSGFTMHVLGANAVVGDSACLDKRTIYPGGDKQEWSNLADSVWLRMYTTEPGTYAEFEICATELDRRIAEGDGCTSAEAVYFDGTGAAGEFIDIRTATGIVASIENTQPLGEVSVSFYDYDGPSREDAGTGAIYLNRNIGIVPENQPTDTVAIRLFLSEDDLFSVLDTGVISEDNLLAITKVPSTGCSAAYPGGGEPVLFRTAPEVTSKWR